MNRPKLSDSAWRELFDLHVRSGMTVAAFCAERDLAVSTFFARRRQLGADSSAASTHFVEIACDASPHEAVAAPGSSCIDVLLPAGAAVRVRRDFDADLLRRVVEALS